VAANSGGDQRSLCGGQQKRFFVKWFAICGIRLYVCIGLSELSHFDQNRQRCSTASQHNPTSTVVAPEPSVRIKSISRWKFNRFLRFHVILETAIGEEVQWFGDDAENIIGTIAFSKGERGWNYAILKRDWAGNFQVCNLTANLYSLPAARIDFLVAMAGTEKGGHSVFRGRTE
jgi:hypothetical protein